MKTVEEVLVFLESERDRLNDLGTYDMDVEYVEYLIEKIKEPANV